MKKMVGCGVIVRLLRVLLPVTRYAEGRHIQHDTMMYCCSLVCQGLGCVRLMRCTPKSVESQAATN